MTWKSAVVGAAALSLLMEAGALRAQTSRASQTASPPQEITLPQAVEVALKNNPTLQAADSYAEAVRHAVAEAKSGYYPRLDFSEGFVRSNNPVFVFGSLLTQRQFTAQDFALGSLNRPGFLNNFQSTVTVDQTLFDAGRTRRAMVSAGLGKEIACEDQRLARMQVIAAVVRAYADAALSREQLNAAVQAMRSAEADLQQAENVRAAGLSTDADVLSIRVHLAAVREQQIRRAADLEVAQAALNDALGQPLDAAYSLTTPLAPAPLPDLPLAAYEESALGARPEARQARLASGAAANQAADARSSLLPEVVLHGAVEADRRDFYAKGGANWLVSAGLRWNLFNGLGDKARIAEAQSLVARSHAQQQSADSAIRLEVRRAYAAYRAAAQRIEVARAAMAEAGESLRITQNRYHTGMNTVTDLLRTESAVLDARTRYLEAVHDQRVAAAMLELAAGKLSEDSEVLN